MTDDRRAETALTGTLDAQAHNDRQAFLIFNATAEVDSAMERVCQLREHGVPQHLIDEILADLAAIYRSNSAERECEQTAAGCLDHLLRDLRDRTANGIRDQLNVKSLARAIRPLLTDIHQDGAKGIMARRALDQLIAQHRGSLDLPSLAQQLGKGRHAQLTAYLQETQR